MANDPAHTVSSMKVITSSGDYIEFNVWELQNNQFRQCFYRVQSRINSIQLSYTPNTLSELLFLDLSPEKIKNICERVSELLLNTPEGARYNMERLFLPEKKQAYRVKGMPPGVVRIFAKDLISYYTGKSWKKVNVQ